MLRPGGRFLAGERQSEPGAQGLHSHGWTPEQAEAFADACRAHGFFDVRVEEHLMNRHKSALCSPPRKRADPGPAARSDSLAP